ncbi:uncharacterized protein [Triticum aestivum]|uniref:uncharacterized protein n=1 Tax=Triticum aestivum TaxID=4565 RepID=UPI001D02DF0A|nr:uncharacterized protein LOC123154291 [Triticum aestivum]
MMGPVEFANIMRRKYPNMADEFIGIILKEHNTRLRANMSEIRYTTQVDMLKLLDELAACLASKCICCQLAGLNTCRLIDNQPAGPNQNNCRELAQMPPAETSDTEGSSTGHVHQARKRVYVHTSDSNYDSTNIVSGQNKKQNSNEQGNSVKHINPVHLSLSPCQSSFPTDSSADLISLVYYHEQLFTNILSDYVNKSGVLFSQLSEKIPHPTQLPCKSFTPDPSPTKFLLLASKSDSSRIIAVCISNDSAANLSRIWIEHTTPRLLLLKGSTIREQIMGKEATSHECCALILRRIAQIERTNSKNHDGAIWRKFMEPDFTTMVIHNIDPTFVISV